MKLSDFERSGKKGYPRFVTQVQDVSGSGANRFGAGSVGPDRLAYLTYEVVRDA
jgi:hypothetical protein